MIWHYRDGGGGRRAKRGRDTDAVEHRRFNLEFCKLARGSESTWAATWYRRVGVEGLHAGAPASGEQPFGGSSWSGRGCRRREARGSAHHGHPRSRPPDSPTHAPEISGRRRQCVVLLSGSSVAGVSGAGALLRRRAELSEVLEGNASFWKCDGQQALLGGVPPVSPFEPFCVVLMDWPAYVSASGDRSPEPPPVRHRRSRRRRCHRA